MLRLSSVFIVWMNTGSRRSDSLLAKYPPLLQWNLIAPIPPLRKTLYLFTWLYFLFHRLSHRSSCTLSHSAHEPSCRFHQRPSCQVESSPLPGFSHWGTSLSPEVFHFCALLLPSYCLLAGSSFLVFLSQLHAGLKSFVLLFISFYSFFLFFAPYCCCNYTNFTNVGLIK